ncbi:hypothetical protein AVEN_273065-1 [Araneus ventricosus]|uniref:Uncharacterized protein n=1 Tax=Araneus ventricosus TaxID=182803 RepID=A0A4Y2PES8_ARAVE|nr:hypothetical protein AVEN_273065-1 [Araneus ventricosus]
MSQHPTSRAYSSPQALGKLVRKVKKSLPSSPRKKQAVVEKLASHVGLLIPSTKPQKKNGLSKDTTECVKAFYYRDDEKEELKQRIERMESKVNGKAVKKKIGTKGQGKKIIRRKAK